MKLDRKDRYIISNQLKILEVLYPNNASRYAVDRTAFEEGYESHYSWAMEHISDSPVSAEDSKMVIDTLEMFRSLKRAYDSMSKNDQNSINPLSVKFSGYDGNSQYESKLLGYARYFVIELERFQELVQDREEYFDFNSHMPSVEVYKRMLKVWLDIPSGTNLGDRYRLTKEQVKEIVDAATHPSHRA